MSHEQQQEPAPKRRRANGYEIPLHQSSFDNKNAPGPLQREMSSASSVREAHEAKLFGGVSESTEFQRVWISETCELTGPDTLSACRSLHKCMSIRDKWLAQFNATPLPQECSLREPVVTSTRSSGGRVRVTGYNIFNRKTLSLPSAEYTYAMKNGVMEVYRASDELKTSCLTRVMSFHDFLVDYNIVRIFLMQ
jgi:hypothetical protein